MCRHGRRAGRNLIAIFERQIACGQHPGAQLVVLRHGRAVLDRATGLADVRSRHAVTPQTPFLTCSVTKAFTGMCVHGLIGQGDIYAFSQALIAPRTETMRAPAALAAAQAAGSALPASVAAISPAAKASPAPVVSMT